MGINNWDEKLFFGSFMSSLGGFYGLILTKMLPFSFHLIIQQIPLIVNKF